MPHYFKSFLLIIDFHWEPDIPALPEGVGVPLITQVEICCLFLSSDSEGEAGLGVVGACVERREQ